MISVPYVSNGKFSVSGFIFYDTARAYYQFNSNHSLSNEAAVIIRNGLYNGWRKLRPFYMTMPVWSPDDSSLVRKSQQVFVEIARLHNQEKVQNLQVVTIRRRVKSPRMKV